MTVRTVMTSVVYSVRPLDSVAHARALMEEHRVNQLPVTVNGRLLGIVTDRDLRDVFPSVFDRRHDVVQDIGRIAVEAVMTPNVLSVPPDASLAQAASIMRRERIGALPVVEGGRLVGIVTRSDLLGVIVAGERTTSDLLQSVG